MGAYEGQGSFAVLAFRFLSFAAAADGNHSVALNWAVPPFISGGRFQVQHSTDGRNFGAIGEVAVIPGQEKYSFQNAGAVPGDNYYRLELDAPGDDTLLSAVAVVTIGEPGNDQLSLRPSMGSQRSRLLFVRTGQPSPAVIRILDGGGHLLWSHNAALLAGDNYLWLEIPALPPGVYYLSLCPLAGRSLTLPFFNF
jgi:hypothetical protein